MVGQYSSDAPRILITRLSAIGDCILTMPMVNALRRAMPKAFIAWAVERAAAPLVEHHAAVDQVIRVPKRVLRKPVELWQLRQELRAWKFDIALDPQALSKSSIISWLSGARRRISFRAPVGRELAPWLATELVTSKQPHVVDRYLELLQPLGVQAAEVRFDVPHSASAEQAMAPLLNQPRLSAGYVVINPGAGWPTKLWPADRLGEIARRLGAEAGVPSVVVWAGEQEKKLAEQIVAAAPGSAILAPPTSLLELAVVMRRARLFVGSDTGPLHMAAAVGTPCVGIYGPTRPEECGPYGADHVICQTYRPAANERVKKSGDNDAMRSVTVETVWRACQQQLAVPRGASAA
jgi:heptosyltransferase-1